MYRLLFVILFLFLLMNLVRPKKVIVIHHPPIRWGTPFFRPPRGRPPFYPPK